ncbi:MAG: polysaccharide deacetylase family protein [Desulfarculus sp.]|nr:MAG: polysaccharide deacetylase family protein [Desulfarculus sp.]
MIWWWLAGAGLGALGFSARFHWWRARRAGAPILMYHSISDDLRGTALPKLKVSPRAFARQLDTLARRGYAAVTLGRALGPGCPPRAAVLTFDDGCRDFYTTAWPLLRARGMAATVFLVSGQIGGHNAWDLAKGLPREELLDAAQIRELAGQGVEFGGHGHSHQDLTGLGEAELAAELADCRRTLSELLGRPPEVFAYPFGLHDQRVRAAMAAAGFRAACTTRPDLLGPASDPLALGRIMVKRSDTPLDFGLKLTRTRSRW